MKKIIYWTILKKVKRIAFGALRTTPSEVLNIMINRFPACALVRLRALSQWHSVFLPGMPDINSITDYSISKAPFDKKYLTLIPKKMVWLNSISGGRVGVKFVTALRLWCIIERFQFVHILKTDGMQQCIPGRNSSYHGDT